MMKRSDEQTCQSSQHSLLKGITVVHSSILVTSLCRVFPIIPSSQTDMPSLTTVTLDKESAFNCKKTVHTKSSSPSSPSFLDITPALSDYFFFPPSFTHTSLPNHSPNSLLIPLQTAFSTHDKQRHHYEGLFWNGSLQHTSSST